MKSFPAFTGIGGVICLAAIGLSEGSLHAQTGNLSFLNNPLNPVIDSRTGQHIHAGLVVVGLYYSTNVINSPQLAANRSLWQLAAVTPIGRVDDSRFDGYFNDGVVNLTGTRPGQLVQVQVRFWSAGHDSYEDAFDDGAALLGQSQILPPFPLGGSLTPPPSVTTMGLSTTIVYLHNANNPPQIANATYDLLPNQLLRGQLAAMDHDNDPVTFASLSEPDLGTLTLNQNGSFTFNPFPNAVGTSTFTYIASDGLSNSLPAQVTLRILPLSAVGTVQFRNYPQGQVVDEATGAPVQPNQFTAGLFATTRSSVTSATNRFPSEFIAGPSTSVGTDEAGFLQGGFNAGTVGLLGTTPGQNHYLQVRVWESRFDSFAEAYRQPNALLSSSPVLGPVPLGGPANFAPVLGEFENLTNIAVRFRTGNAAPSAHSTNFVLVPGSKISVLQGQLHGSDPEGHSLRFALVSPPFLGRLTLQPDGSFQYETHEQRQATDSFEFLVSDGVSSSFPATATIGIDGTPNPGGRLNFHNTPESLVLEETTQLPLGPGIAMAGLYFSPNLDAIANPEIPEDDFILGAAVPVSPAGNPSGWGLFHGGTVALPGTHPGQSVLVQVRIWDNSFVSYADAKRAGSALVAASAVLGPVTLGAPSQPAPPLSSLGLSSMSVPIPPGGSPPVAQDASFSVYQTEILTGQLVANDPEGTPVRFQLNTPPQHGDVTLSANGQFTYISTVTPADTDQFTFTAFDGLLLSAPAQVTIQLMARTASVVFRSGTATRVVDGRTGSPVEAGIARVGLYISTDLQAEPSPGNPDDSFQLVASANVGDNAGPGYFDAGQVHLAGFVPGQTVLYQLRAWAQPYASYEEAAAQGNTLLASSSVRGPLTLRGGIQTPIDFSFIPFGTLILAAPPGFNPPEADNASFTIRQGDTLMERLSGSDPDGTPVTFSLVSAPTQGDLDLMPDGRFQYHANAEAEGTDFFLFAVSDGLLMSAPGSVSIEIVSSAGSVEFENQSNRRVFDGQTGEPIAPGLTLAGLYVSTDLNAQPLPGQPEDPFALLAITPVGRAGGFGLLDAGVVTLRGTQWQQSTLMQVRVWELPWTSYEEALAQGSQRVALSSVLGPVVLGGGETPAPSLNMFDWGPMVVGPAPGGEPPQAQAQQHSIFQAEPLSGSLEGFDPDGTVVHYFLEEPPALGQLTLQRNGSFQYAPFTTNTGLDRFSFRVTDGLLKSEPAEVTIDILPAVGTIDFANDFNSRVIDTRFGVPVAADAMVAGLYFSTNLNAVPMPGDPNDPFQLLRVTPVSPPNLPGYYNGGKVFINGTRSGQLALFQVRVWPAEFASYEEALPEPEAFLGLSATLGPLSLSGGGLPPTSLTRADQMDRILLQYQQGAHRPAALATGFFVVRNGGYNGTLTAFDPDGDPVTFHPVTLPAQGELELQPDGYFTYTPYIGVAGEDFFTYAVSDGALESEPAKVSITITSGGGGQLVFSNNPQAPIIDSRTGQPLAAGVAYVGLYMNPNLNAVPDLSQPTDSFYLVRAVVNAPNGVYLGGIVSVDVPGGVEALFQVRIWSIDYTNYADAFIHNADLIGASPAVRLRATSPGNPPPNLTVSAGLGTIFVGPFSVNQPPLAIFQVEPLLTLFPDAPEAFLLAPDNLNALVLLDGSLSSDPDNDLLSHTWFLKDDTLPAATGPEASLVLPVGEHTVSLLVDDGRASDVVSRQLIILTPGEAVDEILQQLSDSPLPHGRKKALSAHLKSSIRFFEEDRLDQGRHHLEQFQHVVHAQLGRSNPAWAGTFVDLAHRILEALVPIEFPDPSINPHVSTRGISRGKPKTKSQGAGSKQPMPHPGRGASTDNYRAASGPLPILEQEGFRNRRQSR